MTPDATGTAFRDPNRILVQHQAALTLLQARLADPKLKQLTWLDLACGRGQIIAALHGNLSDTAISRTEYWGIDINQECVRETNQIAEGLSFAEANVKVGELADFAKLLPAEKRFDFITLTNTVHEVSASHLGTVLLDCVLRLSQEGTLFIYDVEQVRPPELGAIPWNSAEIKAIVREMLDALGADGYNPEVGHWKHSSVTAWNVQLQRQHFVIDDNLSEKQLEEVAKKIQAMVTQLLQSKLSSCREALEKLTQYGTETADELRTKDDLLHELWAISRALEA